MEFVSPTPEYTLNFQQSQAEQNKQVELITRFAHDPAIRDQPILVTRKFRQSSPSFPPFPANSFETKEIVCRGGICREHMSCLHCVRISSRNPFGL